MKNYNFLFLIFAFCSVIILSACGDDEEEESSSIIFSCKVDGMLWEADEITNAVITETYYQNNAFGKSLKLTVKSEDGTRMDLSISDYEIGSRDECVQDIFYYGLGHVYESRNKQVLLNSSTTFVAGCSLEYFPDGNNLLNRYMGGDGEIEILSCGNGKLSGRFNFKVENSLLAETMVITDGVFEEVEYTYQ